MSENGLQNDVDIQFIEWLKSHGATFPKIEWPALNEAGVKGGIAKENIESDEVMMNIPIKCMMTPEAAFADEVVGPILKEHERLLYGDMLLTVYIMYEHLKGDRSFYFPFLRTLPTPDTVTMWPDRMLYRLEDDAMALKVKQKQAFLQRVYARFITHICRQHPDIMPLEQYTMDLFLFAWGIIQSRAFGKRLPWTALVPFADCLNHSNVQTKYDYNVNGNGFFRLFPTGGNRYPAGTEAFNSYGRRPNANLLTDFGFALLYNEWDSVEVLYKLPPDAAGYQAKAALLRRDRLAEDVFYVYLAALPFKLLAYLRVCCCSESEAESLLEGDTRANTGAAKVATVFSRSSEEAALTRCCELLESILTVHPPPDQTEEEDAAAGVTKPQVSTHNFTTTLEHDLAGLAVVQREVLRRSRPVAQQQQQQGEEAVDRESLWVPGAGGQMQSLPVRDMDIQLLVQYQWIYYYRVTKKNIVVQMVKKLRGLLCFLRSGVLPPEITGADSEAAVEASAVSPPAAHVVVGSGNKLVALVELFAAMSGTTPPPTDTDAAPTTSSSKTDKFHIADYDSSIGDSSALLNAYLKSLLEVSALTAI